ncbi:DUF4149 domain-containing protein [Ideonella sp. TBM-1]|uniref:DUF4149 domain-containing protein n=1 Tax=Ideonella livida TaxID=2707176 RepID=A0A7C9PEL5_9BURK|nr:DUF4149 domain-containing protein [Ideonella livida]
MPGLWAGALWSVAFLGTPAPFATLDRPMAGAVVAHIFQREAALGLLLGVLMLVLERRLAADRAQAGQGSGFSLGMGLALGAIACTVVGYYVLQPWLAMAKAGQSTPLSFGQLHALSFGLFALKSVLVSVHALRLAWTPPR